MVKVNAAGDSKIAAAKAAYEVRSKDPTGIFNQNPNLKALGKGSCHPRKRVSRACCRENRQRSDIWCSKRRCKAFKEVDSGTETLQRRV